MGRDDGGDGSHYAWRQTPGESRVRRADLTDATAFAGDGHRSRWQTGNKGGRTHPVSQLLNGKVEI